MHDHSVEKVVAARLSAFGAAGEPLLIGVSGGADSVALLRALLNVRGDDSSIVVAHLDHALREESAGDAKWVESLSATHGIPVVVERCEVAEIAAAAGRGTEETARTCRYEFFTETAAERGCRFVAVAHTADDQAETVLHRLLRGTGLAGLCGIPESRPLNDQVTLIRPLLSVSRRDVQAYLGEMNQQSLNDESNTDERFTRNRLRHSLLPLLRDQYNPRVDVSLRRLGEQARDVQSILESLAEDLLRLAVVERFPDRVTLTTAPLAAVSRHLMREAFRLLFVQQNWPRGRIRFDDWDRLAATAQSPPRTTSLTLPCGIHARLRRDQMTIERS